MLTATESANTERKATFSRPQTSPVGWSLDFQKVRVNVWSLNSLNVDTFQGCL